MTKVILGIPQKLSQLYFNKNKTPSKEKSGVYKLSREPAIYPRQEEILLPKSFSLSKQNLNSANHFILQVIKFEMKIIFISYIHRKKHHTGCYTYINIIKLMQNY